MDLVNNHRITESVAMVEQQIETFKGAKAYLNLPPQQVEVFADLYRANLNKYGGQLVSGTREVGKVQYQNVLELTKQKLLDILLELDIEFPDLVNHFAMNKENNEKAQNIITTNIYGQNSQANIAAGEVITQHMANTGLAPQDEQKLVSYGLVPTEIEELKHILDTQPKGKAGFSDAVMKWLGSVSAAIAGRGLYEHIPAITAFTQELIK